MKESAISRKKRSWTEKMERHQQPRVITAPPRMAKKFGSGKMLIPTPQIVDRLVREIPPHHLTTINMIREKLARDYHADYTCPITTGIFVWIIANAAEENRTRRNHTISPYWRVIKDNGQLNPKYPGGEEHHAELLKSEGFDVITTVGGNHLRVKDYMQSMISFD